jgi:universal stress protein A
MIQIQTILHPTDFSEGAMQSLQLARSLARDQGARLVILGVAPPPRQLSELDVGNADQVTDLLTHLISLASTIEEVPVEYQILEGLPGPGIIECAEQNNVDLIVMGSTGRGRLPWMVMGSVAEYVARHARCRVLIVKAATRDRALTPDDDSTGAYSPLTAPLGN